jgi:endonuclease V-like protein UPF0215 family
VDLGRLARALGRPVIAVTRRPPEFGSIHAALRKYFPRDAERRWRRLRRFPLSAVPTGGAPVWAASAGCSAEDARAVILRTTRRGFWPEPLRLAHLVARAAGQSTARPRSGRTLKPRPRVTRSGL